MRVCEVLNSGQKGWLTVTEGKWKLSAFPSKNEKERRKALIQFFDEIAPLSEEKEKLRAFWTGVQQEQDPFLPEVIKRDGFLTALVKAYPLHTDWAAYLADHFPEYQIKVKAPIVEVQNHDLYNRVRPTPNGLMAKISVRARRTADCVQIEHSLENFARLAFEQRPWMRKWQTYATLAHGSVYRELNQRELLLPDFEVKGKMILYHCEEHLISEGIKTVSLFPEKGSRTNGIYLIQGTNPYPSQPQTLSSFLENFGKGGSGRGAYEHSWRLIHKHLKALVRHCGGKLVSVVGHSLGGSLGIQISLYSQVFIEESFAFNPPMPQENDRDYFYTLPESSQKKLNIFINGDDFASWRLGASLFGNVYLVLGMEPWNAMNVTKRDVGLVFPYFYKLLKNFVFTIPNHISSYLLDSHFVVVPLTDEELEIENNERQKRIDHMKFLPAMHSTLKNFFRGIRRFFSRSSERRVLQNEIELLNLQSEELFGKSDQESLEKLREIEEKKEELEVQIKRLEMQRRR
jgi:hypothetical protein